MTGDRTFGPDFDEATDGKRLKKQRDVIRDHMLFAGWRTLAEIEQSLGYPQASISAQLRHLRKSDFGGFLVDKRRRAGSSQWEYRVKRPDPKAGGQTRLFETVGR